MSTSSSPIPWFRRATTLWSVGLGLLVIALFHPALAGGFSTMDDATFILGNPQITDPLSQPLADLLLTPGIGYVVPITSAVEAVLYGLGGGDPLPFHVFGLLLHVGVAVLVFRVSAVALHALARDAARIRHVRIHAAGLATLLFVAHPLVVEPVAWATGIKDLLMAAFALGATLAAVQGTLEPSEGKTRRLFILAGVLAVCATLSKPTGAFVGLAWIAWVVVWRLRQSFRGRPADHAPVHIHSLLRPGFAVLAIGGVLTVLSRSMHDALNIEDSAHLVGDWQPLLTLGYQVEHFFWPSVLAPRYRIDRAAGFEDIHTWVGLGALLVIVIVYFASRRRPVVMLGLTLSIATFLPVSGIIPFPRIVGDSYAYMPIAGLSIALSSMFCVVLTLDPRLKRGLVAAWLVVICALGARTWVQSSRWQSSVSLWYPVAERDGTLWPWAWRVMAESQQLNGVSQASVHVWQQFFARAEYPTYLPHFGVALVQAEQLDEAECVMLEAIYANSSPENLLNLVMLMINHPERASRYPEHTIQALNWAWGEIEKDALRLDGRLMPVLDKVSVATHAAATTSGKSGDVWPENACSSLGQPRIDGPPHWSP